MEASVPEIKIDLDFLNKNTNAEVLEYNNKHINSLDDDLLNYCIKNKDLISYLKSYYRK